MHTNMTPDEQRATGERIYREATDLLAEYDRRKAAGENADDLRDEFTRRTPNLLRECNVTTKAT